MQASALCAAELVELADQIVVESGEGPSPISILHEMLSRTGVADGLRISCGGRLPTIAEIFDSLSYPGANGLLDRLGPHFEIVALPRKPLLCELREADLLLRRADGGMAHVSVIASPSLKSLEELLSERLKPESFSPGRFALVVETGARPHQSADLFARRITDASGYLPHDTLLLRFRQYASPGRSVETIGSAGSEMAESDNVSNECAANISEFGRSWRVNHDRARRPRVQIEGGRPLCAGLVDLRQIGPDASTIDLLLYNFDIDGSYPKVEHELALDNLAAKIQDYIARNPTGIVNGPFYQILLQGYADRTGDARYNELLANDREAAVQAYLQTKAKRFLEDQKTPIASLVRFMKLEGGFAPDALPGKNTPHARAVLLWAVPVGGQKPPPRPAPPNWPDAPVSGATSALITAPPVGWNRGEVRIGDTGQSKAQESPQDYAEQNPSLRETRVGAIRRIPISGLSQGNLEPNPTPAAAETADGRAVVLVPVSLDATKPVELLFHLHGHNVGYRQRKTQGTDPTLKSGSVRDIDTDGIERQMEASGRPYVSILPQGTTKSGFGVLDINSYISEVFRKLTAAGVWGSANAAPSVKRVVLSGHSGGGEPISTMMSEPGQPRMPSALGMVALFDGINGDKVELPAVTAWVLSRLDSDLQALVAAGSNVDQKYRYLDASMRFRAYFTSGGYRARHQKLQREIDGWFARSATSLGGASSEFYLMLYANYRTIAVGHGQHEVIMSLGDRLLQALTPAVVDTLNPIRADEVGKVLVTLNVGRFSVFIPETVILSTRKDYDPTPNLSVHIFFSAGSVQGNRSNDVLTHGLRGSSAQSNWVMIGVPMRDTISDWEVRDCLTSVSIRGPIIALRLSGHSRGAESLRNTILQKKITTLSVIDRVTLLDSEENPEPPPNGVTRIPKSRQLAAAGIDPAAIVAYEVNVCKSHTRGVTYISITSGCVAAISGCIAAIGWVRLIRDAMVTQPGIDALVQANQPLLDQLNSLQLPARGSFTSKSRSGSTSLQKFCSDNQSALAAILKNQSHPTTGLLTFLNRNDLARFRPFIFDQGISAHHFFAAEIAHELID